MAEPKKNKKERKTTKAKDAHVRIRISDEKNELVFAICQRFMEHVTKPNKKETSTVEKSSNKGITSTIANWAKDRFKREDITREKVYPIVWEGFKRGFISLNPPISEDLRSKVISKFGLQDHLDKCGGDVYIADVSDIKSAKSVSYRAAETVIALLKSLKSEHIRTTSNSVANSEDFRVHIGFGSGYIAMEVAKRLSSRVDDNIPKLTLHAITSNYYLEEQEKSATTYISYFTENHLDVRCEGYDTTPLICGDSSAIAEHWKNPSLKSCYTKRDDIDIIVTSLADAHDDHGLMRNYFSKLETKENVINTLEKQNWIGDLLFNPYSVAGPIFPDTVQTVPLFSFNELVDIAQNSSANSLSSKQRYIVLIAGPCAKCNRTKTDALYPLLVNPEMRAWTHLVLDRITAQELSEMK